MAYNDFTLDALIAQFLLQVQEESNYFTLFAPLPITQSSSFFRLTSPARSS